MEVLKAVKILSTLTEKPFAVHFIGNGNEIYAKQMENYISTQGIEKYTKMWGYGKDVQSILKEMQVGIVPSLNEAFGRVTVEFMMEKMPVIGANTGGTTELISNDQDGFLYHVGNPNDLAKCMAEYLRNPDLIKEHGQKGYEKASVNFRKQNNTDRIKELYDSILKGGKNEV
jgi:glycosyltransferase involved in cell wall biosynthesis